MGYDIESERDEAMKVRVKRLDVELCAPPVTTLGVVLKGKGVESISKLCTVGLLRIVVL